MARTRTLRSLSLLYVGFVLLVLIAQLSGHLLEEALSYYNAASALEIAKITNETANLAYSASAVGLAFGLAVIFTVRRRLDVELGVYVAAGLPSASAVLLIIRSHSFVPAASALATGAVAGLIDSLEGLDPLIPVGLSLAFLVMLLAWLTLETFARYSAGRIAPSAAGRVG